MPELSRLTAENKTKMLMRFTSCDLLALPVMPAAGLYLAYVTFFFKCRPPVIQQHVAWWRCGRALDLRSTLIPSWSAFT